MDFEHQLRAKIASVPVSKLLILGVGNTLKADDGVGPAVCEGLKPILPGQVIEGGTAPENYVQKILNFAPKLLLIVDAMDFGGEPGTIRLFEPEELGGGLSSTHALTPRTFTDLIAGQCGTEILYVGIQPGDVTMGAAMTCVMEAAAKECVRCIADVLSENTKH